MRKFIMIPVLISIMVSVATAESPDDMSAIRETAMNYMQSWYDGDAEMMTSSIHETLCKRHFRNAHDREKNLRHISASEMISYTAGGYGKRLCREACDITVVILDHYQKMANVKVVSPHYYEYLHVVKMNGKWVIVNTLYQKKHSEAD